VISGETAAISEKRQSDREEYASMISSSWIKDVGTPFESGRYR
jgi:hypothetical protein